MHWTWKSAWGSVALVASAWAGVQWTEPRAQDAQELRPEWTAEDAAAHAARYNDLSLMRQLYMDLDVEGIGLPLPPDREPLPFPVVAFNTPDYALTGRVCHGLSSMPLDLFEPLQGTVVSVNRPQEGPSNPDDDELWAKLRSDVVLAIVASGPAPLTNVEQWAISRSHPHYFFQGTFRSEIGDIDWIALHMATGVEVAVVNGRILDLSQGHVIVVRQEEDASVRIHQQPGRLETGRSADHAVHIEEMMDEEWACEFLQVGTPAPSE